MVCALDDMTHQTSLFSNLVLDHHPNVHVIKQDELFATFHMADVFLNRVIGTTCDPVTMTPEYKVTAVRLERV
jgi:predicted molibdopterin-dependent oxidoreductase YjgC